MGFDGGEAGRRMAMEEEYIRSELQDSTSFCNSFWVSHYTLRRSGGEEEELTPAWHCALSRESTMLDIQ
jgi:hypothetical protein